jgi:hypothetical protein
MFSNIIFHPNVQNYTVHSLQCGITNNVNPRATLCKILVWNNIAWFTLVLHIVPGGFWADMVITPSPFCHGFNHSVMASTILSWLQPFCHGFNHSVMASTILSCVMASTILSWLQPFCHGINHSVMASTILSWHQPFCHGFNHSVMASTILSWLQPFCYDLSWLLLALSCNHSVMVS